MARLGRIFSLGLALAACTNDSDPAAVAAPNAATRDLPQISRLDPQALHAAVLTLDTHVDIPLDFATDAVDPLDSDQQANLLKMQEGGLDAAFFIVYVGQTARTPENYAQAQADALTKFAAIHRMTEELYPDRISLAYRAADVERMVAEGKLVAAIGVENGYVLGADLGMLDRYYELGARYISLAHDGHNDLADSARPSASLGDVAEEHDGVSELGARAIRRMNELGIMVDISHASKQTAIETIELSAAPVIASHSSIRAVADHVRNLDDETLLALKANGGVVQAVAYGGHLKVQPPEQRAALDALAARLGLTPPINPTALPEALRVEYENGVREIDAQWPPANVQTFIDHIDYAVKLIGIDHVGISSDFGGGGGIVGWADARETSNVTNELIARGYSEEAIRKLWGGNLLRVWREVERVAEQL